MDKTQFIEQFEATVRALAEENPDFVYVTKNDICLYAPNDDNPMGCIVGAAATRLGASQEALRTWDAEVASPRTVIEDMLNDPHSVSYAEIAWLQGVQTKQDQGVAWAEAVERVDKETGR